jgi:hypothetical protein
MTVEERLERAAAPDAGGARERARRVILATPPARPRRRRTPFALAGIVAVAALALTPPGEAIGRWLRGLVRADPPPVRVQARLGKLPGQVLAIGPGGAYVIVSDGARKRLGRYDGAAWSPHARFVAATRGPLLRAVDPEGRVRWSLTAAAPVADPRWSSEGYRIAYRRDNDLRVVAGDGSGDHPLVDGVQSVPVAWRQGPGHELAVARRGGAIELWSADAGTRAWSYHAGTVRTMAWRPDGRLVVVTDARLLVLGGDRGDVRRVRALGRVDRAAIAPAGDQLALADGRGVRLVSPQGTGPTRLLPGAPVTSLAWSVDGGTVLATVRDQWYFVPRDGRSLRATPVRGISSVADWCCPEGSVVIAPGFADAPDLYLRTLRTDSRCGRASWSWASTVPFADGPRNLPPHHTIAALGPGDAVVAIGAYRDRCGPEPRMGTRSRLRIGQARSSDWPGRRTGDPPLLRIITRPTGTYIADVWIFARDAAGRARADRILRSIGWAGDLDP